MKRIHRGLYEYKGYRVRRTSASSAGVTTTWTIKATNGPEIAFASTLKRAKESIERMTA